MTDINLTIDGQAVSVPAGTTILEATKTLGREIPHYCYHPGLSIAGNCRMCLVMVEKMPKPVISCKTPVGEGMVVATQTPEVKAMQQSVMEFLLINHPLDCPTCDQAGECRLQDYYMKFDLKPSRFHEGKVHKDKMVDLGADVMLDEERCVVCTRCVRFCEEIAGTGELFVQQRGDHSMVTTFPGKPLTNPYAGNVVDVCPVGALTSKDFRYKKRVWFLSRTNSVCDGCARGCNIEIHHAERKVYRYKPRYNPEVNGYWMCDEGRNSYKSINENRRLRAAVRGQDGKLTDVSIVEAITRAQAAIAQAHAGALAFVASARESNESIDAFVAFAKQNGATEVYFSKNDPANPYFDDKLISADKNPNLSHIKVLGLKPLSAASDAVKTLIVQRDLSEPDVALAKTKGFSIAALFATNVTLADELAHAVLPLAAIAEQDGHFTNLQGLVQEFVAAFEPHGEAKTIGHYIGLITASQDAKKAG